jgi:urease gamma subunit
MTTGLEFAGALKSVSAVIGIAKTALDAAKKINNAELISLIADLNLETAKAKSSLAELMNQLTEFKEENTKLKGTIRELQEASKKENQLIRKDSLYYEQDDEGPFCPCCYKKDKSKSLLQKSSQRAGTYYYKCNICEWHSESKAIKGYTAAPQVNQNNLSHIRRIFD